MKNNANAKFIHLLKKIQSGFEQDEDIFNPYKYSNLERRYANRDDMDINEAYFWAKYEQYNSPTDRGFRFEDYLTQNPEIISELKQSLLNDSDIEIGISDKDIEKQIDDKVIKSLDKKIRKLFD